MTDWQAFSRADFDSDAAPVQDALFITPAPAVRPGQRARAGAQLAGQTDIFAELAELTTEFRKESAVIIKEMHPDSNALYGTGIYAMVQDDDGSTLHLSQLDGESYWVADGLFGPNSYPHWCHGFGSRCTMLRTVGSAGLVAALDQAAARPPAELAGLLPITVTA